jgi:hypothetical protein
MIAGVLALALGIIADLIRINRILIEDSLEMQKRQRFTRATPENAEFESVRTGTRPVRSA